jgi:hypothetical protein
VSFTDVHGYLYPPLVSEPFVMHLPDLEFLPGPGDELNNLQSSENKNHDDIVSMTGMDRETFAMI